MTYFNQNVEVLIDLKHYDPAILGDIIRIDEDDYSSLYVSSIKGSMLNAPAGICLGQVWITSTVVMYEIASNPILVGITVNAIYDLMKYMKSKIPLLVKSCNPKTESIYIDSTLNIKNKDDAEIVIDLQFYSDELNTISDGLEQLKEIIESLEFKGGVKITYADGKWHISNET